MNNWFEIIPLPNQIYAICEPHHNENVKSFLVIGSKGALLFDTGMGIGNIKEEVEKLWQGDLIVVNSHSHFDHVGDNWRFPVVYGAAGENADLIAKEGCERLKIKPYKREIALDGHVFDLGNRRLEAIYTPGHSNDCLMLYDQSHKVLLCGDSYYNGPLFIQMNDLYFGKSSLEEYYLSIEKVLKLYDEIEFVYSSHNDFIVNKSKLKTLFHALDDLRRGKIEGKSVSGTTYNYYGDPQPLMKYQFDDFYIIADAESMEVQNRARLALKDGNYTCCIIKNQEIYTSMQRGVKPLLDFLDDQIDLCGGIAADKVIGKAAAFLYVLLGVSYVYADIISKPALDVFKKYGIRCEYSTLVEAIENRTKTGYCPMERAVWSINAPEEVPEILKNALKALKHKQNTIDKDNVKQWHICQIEEKRDALQNSDIEDGQLIDQEEVKRQLQILNDEKKRRGYR